MAFECYCVLGLMAKCTAKGYKEEKCCHFFEKSSSAERCMSRIEAIDNHCDCQKAQKFALTGKCKTEEESEINIDLLEDSVDALERVTSCATCEKLDSNYSPKCKLWIHMEENELRDCALRCSDFELTASCVICKDHDCCHDGTSGDNYSLIDKINIAQTCKKYNPITNNGPFNEDDIPF